MFIVGRGDDNELVVLSDLVWKIISLGLVLIWIGCDVELLSYGEDKLIK